MTVFLNALAGSLLSASAIAIGLAWFARTSIEKYVGVFAAKHVEEFKHSLNEQLETFRSHLATEQAADRLRFEKMLEFRIQQLSEFYWPIYIRLQKDNAIWERVFLKGSPNQFPKEIARSLEINSILPNHEEVVNIIQTKFYLAEKDDTLEALPIQYARHIAVYRAMRSSPHYDEQDPISLGEPWPSDLFEIFTQRLLKVQHEYDTLLVKTGKLADAD
jgi:hypothetical protein